MILSIEPGPVRIRLYASACARRIERVVRKNEERFTIRSSEEGHANQTAGAVGCAAGRSSRT
jgi:hypothetical protein